MALRYIGRHNGARTRHQSNRPPCPPTPSAERWVSRAPAFARPYLQLSRYDRPAGFWLLGLPCLIGLALAADADRVRRAAMPRSPFSSSSAPSPCAAPAAPTTTSSIADIDAKVARTALRPLPSGAVSLRQAWIWLLAQCVVGLGVAARLAGLRQAGRARLDPDGGALPADEADHLVAAGLARPDLQLGRAGRSRSDAGDDHAGRRHCSMARSSCGRLAMTRSTRSRTARTTR